MELASIPFSEVEVTFSVNTTGPSNSERRVLFLPPSILMLLETASDEKLPILKEEPS